MKRRPELGEDEAEAAKMRPVPLRFSVWSARRGGRSREPRRCGRCREEAAGGV